MQESLNKDACPAQAAYSCSNEQTTLHAQHAEVFKCGGLRLREVITDVFTYTLVTWDGIHMKVRKTLISRPQ